MHLQVQYFFFLLIRYTFHKWTPLWTLKHKSCTTFLINITEAIYKLISKWNKHHLFSNPCLKLIFRHINVFFTFWNTIHFFERNHIIYGFWNGTFVLQCNSGPRTSALSFFWPFPWWFLTVVNFSPTALAKYSSMWHDFSILIIPLIPSNPYASNRLFAQGFE